MKLRTGMIITVLTGLAGVLVVEGFALGNDIDGDTLSEIVADAGDATPALPFALAALVGHFVSRRKAEQPTKNRIFMGLGLLPLAGIVHLVGVPVWVAAIVGLGSGYWLWPLSAE